MLPAGGFGDSIATPDQMGQGRAPNHQGVADLGDVITSFPSILNLGWQIRPFISGPVCELAS